MESQLAFVLALLWARGAAASCVQPHSLGKCAACTSNEQCEHGRFCCPFLKKCVASPSEPCGWPIASCIPPCDSDNPHDCQCENQDFPDNWVQCTAGQGDAGVVNRLEPNPISRTVNVAGWCVGFFKWSMCWLADEQGNYAKSGQPWECSQYDGYSADEWCYRPPEPKARQETTGTGTGTTEHTAVAGAMARTEETGNFQCPSSWYAGDAPTDPDAEAWTMAHNVFRCMHNVGFVQWSNPVADSARDNFANQPEMVHSDCYGVPPPAGPAGENLFWGKPVGFWKPAHAVSNWYDEVHKCSSFPGCGGQYGRGTGHFTALIWAGVQAIGCTSNKFGIKACRYKGHDKADCTTPNMGGCYHQNVPAMQRDLGVCKAKVQQCFGGKAVPDNIEAFSVVDGAIASPHQFPWMFAATGGLLGLVALAAVLVRRSKNHFHQQYRVCLEGSAATLHLEGAIEVQEW